MPRSAPTVETLDRIQDAFPGGADPAIVAIKADPDAADTKNAVNELRAKALATGQMHGPIDVDVSPDHTVVRVAIPPAGKGTDGTSTRALNTLRNQVLPETIGQVPGATWAVTGGTAASADANALLKHAAPLVFGFVLVFAFLLLLVSFRSIVIALKAIV